MNKNVIMNEELMENVAENAVEEITTSKSGRLVKTSVGLVLVGIGGVMLYKKVIKPIVAKVKAKKAAKAMCTEVVDADDEPIKPIFDDNGNVIED